MHFNYPIVERDFTIYLHLGIVVQQLVQISVLLIAFQRENIIFSASIEDRRLASRIQITWSVDPSKMTGIIHQ